MQIADLCILYSKMEDYASVLPSLVGLRPQARVGAQPPQAALSAETEAVREAD